LSDSEKSSCNSSEQRRHCQPIYPRAEREPVSETVCCFGNCRLWKNCRNWVL